MKLFKRWAILAFIPLFHLSSMGQGVETSAGTDFAFVFLQNRIRWDGQKLNTLHDQISQRIYVTNTETTSTTVKLKFAGNSSTRTIVTFIDGANEAAELDVVLLAGQTKEIQVVLDDKYTVDIEDPCGGYVRTEADTRWTQLMNNGEISTKLDPDGNYKSGNSQKAFFVTSNTWTGGHRHEVSVHAESSQSKSRDVSLILPIDALGTEYVAITGDPVQSAIDAPSESIMGYDGDGSSCPAGLSPHRLSTRHGGPSEIGILAIEDNTVINVYYPTATNPFGSLLDQNGHAVDYADNVGYISFTLNEFEAIQLQSDDVDLTGTRVIASESSPIAVFSGNMATHMVVESEDYAFDHIYEQMFPVNYWGNEYIAISTTQETNLDYEDENRDFYKIVAFNEGETWVTLTHNGSSLSPIKLEQGQFIYITPEAIFKPGSGTPYSSFTTGNSTFIEVSSDGPICVAQFMASQGVLSSYGINQDPSMAILTPMHQRVTQTSLPIPPSLQGTANKEDFILIVRDQSDAGNIEWENASGTHAVSNTCWEACGSVWEYQIIGCELEPGCTTCVAGTSISNNTTAAEFIELRYNGTVGSGFQAYIFGTDQAESYMAAAGAVFTSRGTESDKLCLGLDGNLINPEDLAMRAYGGSASSGSPYTWSIISGPGSFSTELIGNVFDDETAAQPTLVGGYNFPETGTYKFLVEIESTELGASTIEYEASITVAYCCDNLTSDEYETAPGLITDETQIWTNKVKITDFQEVIVGDGQVLDISSADIVMGECAKIIIKEGGALRANNTVFRACNPEIPWRGIVFEGDAEYSQILSCEFKNAIRAIDIQGGASVQIANNLFYNNYEGIRIENETQGDFTESINGNKFIIDSRLSTTEPAQIFIKSCDGIVLDDNTHHGIVAINTDFQQAISKNEFSGVINSSSAKELKAILFNSSSGTISQNEFQDVSKALSAQSSSDAILFVDNKIVVTPSKTDISPQIDLHSCSQVTLVKHNDFKMLNTALNGNGHYAVYANGCSEVMVQANTIYGFNAGVVFNECDDSYILDNEIKNSLSYGIYVKGTMNESGNDETIMIGCNEIDMDLTTESNIGIGIGFQFISSNSKIFNNCISDCMIALYGNSEMAIYREPVPIIQGNFLYNYEQAGLYTRFYSSDELGVSPNNYTDLKENTFFSNSEAWDMHVLNIGTGNEFFVNTSFGLKKYTDKVTVHGTNDEVVRGYSSASCAKQVYHDIYTSNADIESLNQLRYDCDGDETVAYGVFSRGETSSSEVLNTETLDPSLEEYGFILQDPDRSIGVMIAFDNVEYSPGVYKIMEMSKTSTELSEFEKTRVALTYHLLNGEFVEATNMLHKFDAISQEELSWKNIQLIRLDLIQNNKGVSSLTDNQLQLINTIIEENNAAKTEAISLYNLAIDSKEYDYVDLTIPTLVFEKQIADANKGDLKIYPNPAKSEIQIAIKTENGTSPNISVMNELGQVIQNVDISFSTGVARLDVSEMNSGLYIVIVETTDGQQQVGRFMKE